ncbi:MAG: alpha-L-rhamnosidase C-terminal domain-containing protein [Ginsengibacter sp.]
MQTTELLQATGINFQAPSIFNLFITGHQSSAIKNYFIFFLLCSCNIYGQEIPESKNRLTANGIEVTKHVWKASWIAHPTASQMDYGVFLFRKRFQLSEVPKNFFVFISADNRYKLYINGKYIANGPARGDEFNWNYETIDIAALLKPGENLVAAEVINFGINKPLAQHSFKTGFILQAKDSAYDEVNTGNDGWKVMQNLAYHPISVSFDMVKGFYAAGPCDSVDAKLYPWNWNELNFNDAAWVVPRISNQGVGRGFIYGNGLHLVPREIPLPETKEERFKNVVRTNYPQGAKGGGFISGIPTIIKSHSTISFLLDQNYLTIGYPQFSISKGSGSKIKVIYAEALRDKEGQKGNRNETDGKEISGYYDWYYPDGGDNRLFETLWLRTFRYVQLDIETGNEDLVINDFHNIFSAYPFTQKATFNTDDPKLKQVWDVAWRTARLCANETYFDCPYYEQLQYVGDTRIQALISLYVTGDDRLMKNALELFDHSRIPDGLTLSRYPSAIPQIIPTYSLMWINMLHDYHMYRGDSLFIGRFTQGIQDVLSWFEKKIDHTGMLGNLEWWQFTDYTPEFQSGIPDGADDGHSALISLQFVYALENAADLFTYFGQSGIAEKYTKLATDIKRAVLLNCYDNSRGLIAETPEKKRFSLHTTLFAILTNTIEKEKQAEILQKALADKNIIPPAIYFKFYLFMCLQKTGLGDLYLYNIDTWYKMLSQGLTTFAEIDTNPRSDCHAWSASPLFDFLSLVAGIQPSSPGFETVLIAPNFGKLHLIDARFPHPKGDIIIHLQKDTKDKISGYVELPQNLKGTFRYKDTEIALNGGKQVINH